MKATLFTSNQPRHLALARKLSSVCEEVFCIQECSTVFPGKIADFFQKSSVMQTYFSNVMEAEQHWFGEIAFSNPKVRCLSMKAGDISHISQDTLQDALTSDIYVVFGASYIKGWLVDFLIDHKAINIHMGLSPYYRGSSCNFWALYDNNPKYVGATIHRLGKGLDSGPILYHCLPLFKNETSFQFTMKAVSVAHKSLIERISSGEIFRIDTVRQDRSKEIRYSKNIDFTDEVAKNFLQREIDLKTAFKDTSESTYPELFSPYFA